jgi:hypothetical protein
VVFGYVYPRRHHCRICGKSFCHEHANEWVTLTPNTSPIRLCAPCKANLLPITVAEPPKITPDNPSTKPPQPPQSQPPQSQPQPTATAEPKEPKVEPTTNLNPVIIKESTNTTTAASITASTTNATTNATTNTVSITAPIVDGNKPKPAETILESGKEEPKAIIDILVKTVDVPLKTVDVPLKTVDVPLKTVDVPLKTVDLPLKTVDLPLKTVDVPLKTVDVPLKAVKSGSGSLPLPPLPATALRSGTVKPLSTVMERNPVAPPGPQGSQVSLKTPLSLRIFPSSTTSAAAIVTGSATATTISKSMFSGKNASKSAEIKLSNAVQAPQAVLPKYIAEIRLVHHLSAGPMEGEWQTLSVNLNPHGTSVYLSYRLSADEKTALRDIRVLIPGQNENPRDRLPRGYTLLDFDMHKSVLSGPPTHLVSGPPTYLCYCGLSFTRSSKTQRPITAIEATVVNELSFHLPSPNFVRVQGDFGGNCNVNSKTHIYLSISFTHSL